MRQHDQAGMVGAQCADLGGGEALMCTSQWPAQAIISTSVRLAVFCARYSSGSMIHAFCAEKRFRRRAWR